MNLGQTESDATPFRNSRAGSATSRIGAGFSVLAALCALLLGSVLGAGQTSDPADLPAGSITNAASSNPTSAEERETIAHGGAKRSSDRSGVHREALITFGKDVELKAGDTADTVVAIGGSARIHGKVLREVVAIGGDVEVDGEVGQEVVAVLGSVKLAPGATIKRDAVAIGGKIEVAEGATIRGRAQEIDFGEIGLSNPKWLRSWFGQCVLKVRPLAPQVGWLWGVAGAFFLFYLLVAVAVPRPVQACVDELTRRPATTFLLGLLAKLLLPVILIILILTGIGLIVVPFIVAALFLGAIVGKVALLEWLGSRLSLRFGIESVQRPVVGLVLGAVIVTLLYMVPVLGLATFLVLGVWGLGAAVTAAAGGLRRELPEKRAAASPSAPGVASVAAGFAETPGGTPASAMGVAPDATATTPAAAPAVLPDVLVYPKAGFWERMGAAFLDLVLVGVVMGLAHSPRLGPLVALAYFAGMWTWKGTTIGGILLGLKVVRYDGQPVTFAPALVRALAAGFSICVLFLGFLWIAWDKDKQAWHDKIAGTVVLRLPRGMPLVCL